MAHRYLFALLIPALVLLTGTACNDTNSTSPQRTLVDASDDVPGDDAFAKDVETDSRPNENAITIQGRLLHGPSTPASGKEVGLYGGLTTTTDDQGRFEFTNVRKPYSLVAFNGPAEDRDSAIIYRGLTRTDPVILQLPPGGLTPLPSAELQGRVFDDTSDENPQLRTVVGFAPADDRPHTVYPASLNRLPRLAGSQGRFDTSVPWVYGASSNRGRLFALQWEQNDDELPTEYVGFGGTPPIDLQTGERYEDQTLVLTSDPSERQVSVDVQTAVDHRLQATQLLARYRGTDVLVATTDSDTPTLNVPHSQVVDPVVVAIGTRNSRISSIAARRMTDPENGQAVTLEMNQSASLEMPPDRTSGVDSNTTFSWSSAHDSVHVLKLTSGSSPDVYVVTDDTAERFPTLDQFDISRNTDASYVWSIDTIDSASHINEIATPSRADLLRLAVPGRRTNSLFDSHLQYTRSTGRRITTK